MIRHAIAKSITYGRTVRWEVYDTGMASWPKQLPGFGKIEGNFKTEEECQVEADRLNEFFSEGKVS